MSQDNLTEYSVSELSGAVKKSIEEGFGYVRVQGELGRVSRPQSGHLYVDLKDEKAVLAAVIWKGVAQKMKIQPEQGLEVICTGKLTTFPGQSRYQLVIDHIEPAGIGALMALLEERKKCWRPRACLMMRAKTNSLSARCDWRDNQPFWCGYS